MHTDVGVLTVAPLSTVPGLQSLGLDADGRWRWHDLEPNPGLVVVFAGEVLHRLTDAAIRPLFHRILRPTVERVSVPFFQRPP